MFASPASDDNAATAATKRRSGRVTRKPDLYTFNSPANGAKRKRGHAADEQDLLEDDTDGEATPSADDEDEPDDEELREEARKARSAPKKPAAKRSKAVAATGTANPPPRTTTTKTRRPPARAKVAHPAHAKAAGGLYTEVFARNREVPEVVDEWIQRFGEHESQAVADLVNFVLRCSGCDLSVDEHDIEDPDGCTNKLGDLQDEFQAQNVTEYPIVAKGKGTASFKRVFFGFFHLLIEHLNTAGILFTNVELIENVQVWLSGMSAAQNRPFRHTATAISLVIITALCEVGRDLLNASAKMIRQSESEDKKKKVNKGRVSALQEEAKAAQQTQELLHTIVKDWFDTIFIHRYRDVDARIRVDCVEALGDWVVTYPDIFFDGQHLRYLGWVLSDSSAPARHEVLRQLLRLYRDKDKLPGLKTFTERFRSRIVEMATLDSDIGVRAAAVELLDLLREAGLLEPDDIDAIGRLVFDSEIRVRKAVVDFIAESINDAYESKIEELGGEEALEEILPESDAVDSPCLEWLKLKCLVEMLESYDALDGEVQAHSARDDSYLHTTQVESRFIVAADSLYSHIPVVREWEAIAGYLLHDFSDQTDKGDDGFEVQLKLSEQEEVILLEILNSSIKGGIARLTVAGQDKKSKLTKKQREDLAEEQEQAARQLATLVPRLLKRFGEAPQTASAILRLERVVNLEAFRQFSNYPSTYATLLNDINKQFMTHGNEEVLAEASRALLRAKDYHELGDLTEETIETLWEDTMSTFSTLTQGHDLTVRTSLDLNVLDALTKTVLRMEKLSTISRPVSHFEAKMTQGDAARKTPNVEQPATPLRALIALVHRGIPVSGPAEDPEDAVLEDSLSHHAASALSFYFLWATSELRTKLESLHDVSDDEIDSFAAMRDDYVSALDAVVIERGVIDDLAITFAGMLCDIHTLMSTLRHVKPARKGREDFIGLAMEMDAPMQKQILTIFAVAETAFAKKSGRTLEKVVDAPVNDDDDAAINADPMDEDPVSEAEDALDDEDEDMADAQGSQGRRAAKLQQQLVAEQRLCELAAKMVLTVLGGMMDREATTKRLERNKARLGPNFKEVLGHLDAGRASGNAGKLEKMAAGRKAKAAGPKAGAAKSEEVVVDDEDDEDEGEQGDEDDEGSLRRRELLDEPDEPEHEDEDDVMHDDAESVLGD